jgi:hypothetical protein
MDRSQSPTLLLAIVALAAATSGCSHGEAGHEALVAQRLAEENEGIARQLFEALSRGDAEAVDSLYADDFRLWTAGSMPISGEHPRAEAIEGMSGIFAVFPKGIRFDVTGTTAQGERVAVEAESHGDHISGIHYNNLYHFLVIVRDGKIRELREYMDTQMAQEVLFDSLAGAGE